MWSVKITKRLEIYEGYNLEFPLRMEFQNYKRVII